MGNKNILDVELDFYYVGSRISRLLRRNGVETIRDLLKKPLYEFECSRNCGPVALENIRKLKELFNMVVTKSEYIAPAEDIKRCPHCDKEIKINIAKFQDSESTKHSGEK